MLLLFKFVVLFLSFLGYYLFLYKKYHIKKEFIPIVVVSGIGVALFFSGLLNIMPLAAFIVTISGIFMAIKYFQCSKEGFLPLCSMGIIFLLCSTVYFAVFLRGHIFIEYDNFSHWALVVSEMLRTDQLPNFQSSVITFQAYPTGSASFIYYVCKIIGNTDACMAFSQTIIELCCLTTLFAFAKKNTGGGY